MLLPLDEKLAYFRDAANRARLNELAQGDDNPLKGLARWEGMVIYDVVAPENEQYRGRQVGEIAEAQGREPWDVAHRDRDGRRAQHELRHRATRRDRRRLEGAGRDLARRPRGDRRVGCGCAPRPPRVVQLRHRAPRPSGARAWAPPARGGGAPHHRRPGAPLRLARSRPGRGWRARRRRRPRSRTRWRATRSACRWTFPVAQAGCTRARRACSTCW